MKNAIWSAGARLAALVLVAATTSCGDPSRQGTGSSYLIVTSLTGASGADPGKFGGTLNSDVVTVVNNNPTIFNDLGEAGFTLALKDPGPAGTVNAPTINNAITIDRYHVSFIRADGRNTQGVDVPYSFDGAVTVTVLESATAAFTLVRHQAKEEAPLRALAASPVLIDTIAEVTFYGHDQTGRAVSAVARMSVNFGNFGDPN